MYARQVHNISKSRSETPSGALSGRLLLSSMVFSAFSLLGHSGLQGTYQGSQHQHQLKFSARSNLEKAKARGSINGSRWYAQREGICHSQKQNCTKICASLHTHTIPFQDDITLSPLVTVVQSSLAFPASQPVSDGTRSPTVGPAIWAWRRRRTNGCCYLAANFPAFEELTRLSAALKISIVVEIGIGHSQ